MIIERIRIQIRISLALHQSKKLEPKVSVAAQIALNQLTKALNDLAQFTQKYPLFSKILRVIDKYFGFKPLNQEIAKINGFNPVIQQNFQTPESSVELDFPELPAPVDESEVEIETDDSSTLEDKDLAAAPITEAEVLAGIDDAQQDPLKKEIQALKEKYAECFEGNEILEQILFQTLLKREPEKRCKFMKNLQNYLSKIDKWIPMENYLPIILENPDSIGEMLYFYEDVLLCHQRLKPNELKEEMDTYIDDLFKYGFYWIPGIEALLTKDRVEAFLLDPQYEESDIIIYIESIQKELEGTNNFLLPLLQECLNQIGVAK